MTWIAYSFLAVLTLSLATVVVGSPDSGSPLIWTGYGLQANMLGAAAAVGAHLVLAAVIYRVLKAFWPQEVRRPMAGPHRPATSVSNALPVPVGQENDYAEPQGPDIALIGLRGLTARAAERGDIDTARELARRGLSERPGTGWLEELLDEPAGKKSGN